MGLPDFWGMAPDAAGAVLPRVLSWGHTPAEAYMNNLNSILIEGNLVRDPLLRSTAKGTQICTFTLASNRFFKQDSGLEKEVGFFEVESWSKLADHCYSQGHKGRGVRVVGRLKQDRWNGTDGKSHSRVTIVAEHVEFRPEFKREENDPAGYTGTPAQDLAAAALGEFPPEADEAAFLAAEGKGAAF
jgi:single-strand DNA-binding protein